MSISVERGRSGLIVFLLAALPACTFGIGPASAQEPPSLDAVCKLRCAPKKQEAPFVEIDANTGAVIAGATTFAEGAKVKVISSGRNPYKYEYRTNIKSQSLEVSLFTSFLGLIPGADQLAGIFTADGLAGITGGSRPPSAALGASPPPSECSKPQLATLDGLIQSANDLRPQIETLKAEAAKIDDSNEKYKKILAVTDKTSLGSPEECSSVCIQAAQALPNLDRLIDMSGFEGNVKKLQTSSKDIGEKSVAFRKAVTADCLDEIEEKVEAVEANAKAAKDQAEKALPKIDDIKKVKPSLALLKQRIQKTLADEDAFSEERFPYTQAGPTAVKITLSRKNLREENAAEKEVGQVDLTLGQSRFSMTAGVGFSTIEDVTVVRQGNKFGEENQSDLRPSLTVMLNTQLGHFFKTVPAGKDTSDKVRQPSSVSAGVAIGLVMTQRNSTTEAEFIAGPSFGFLDDKFVVVLGYHTARVQSLGGGYKIGQDIPADLKDIPVDKDWKSGAMLAFTYKIR